MESDLQHLPDLARYCLSRNSPYIFVMNFLISATSPSPTKTGCRCSATVRHLCASSERRSQHAHPWRSVALHKHPVVVIGGAGFTVIHCCHIAVRKESFSHKVQTKTRRLTGCDARVGLVRTRLSELCLTVGIEMYRSGFVPCTVHGNLTWCFMEVKKPTLATDRFGA